MGFFRFVFFSVSPDLHLLKNQCLFLGLARCRLSFILSRHLPQDAATIGKLSCYPNRAKTSLFVLSFMRQVDKASCGSFLWSVNKYFWVFFLVNFSQIFRGSIDSKKEKKNFWPLLSWTHDGFLVTDTKELPKRYSKDDRLELMENDILARWQAPEGSQIYHSEDQETGHLDRFLSSAKMPKAFQEGQHQKDKQAVIKRTKHCQAANQEERVWLETT